MMALIGTYLGTQASCKARIQRALQAPDALWLDDCRGPGPSLLMAGARDHIRPPRDLAAALSAVVLAPQELMAGFISYPSPANSSCRPDLPEHGVGIYSWHLRFYGDDVFFVGDPSAPSWLDLQKPLLDDPTPFQLSSTFVSSWQLNDYAQAFTRIQDYLQAGDCYQINLCQHYAASFTGDPLQAYLRLRDVSPVPYGAFIRADKACILSLSPERFLSIHGRSMLSSPIKGTTPVYADPAANAASRQALADSAKN
ncbi:MAG: hypothetical protein HKM02_06570, partial [Pseudomonadales bacterium]|nr:hypothetical protein [Pseudomonadales bacterium]